MFETFAVYGLWNLAAATLLALGAWVIGLFVVRPGWRHGSWLLAMLKLVTPPLVVVPILTVGAGDAARNSQESDRSAAAPPHARQPFAPQPEHRWDEPPEIRPAVPSPAGRRKDVALPQEKTTVRLAWNQPPMPAAEHAENPPEPRSRSAPARGGRGPSPPRFDAVFVVPSLPAVLRLLGLAWVVTSVCWLFLSLWRTWRFWRALGPVELAEECWQREARSMAERLGLPRVPAVWLVDASVSPMLWLFPTIRLVLPRQLMDRLDPEQRRSLLLHELAHFRRGDHWIRVLELSALALYWWCPVAWWIRRRLREAEEECCDAWVVEAAPQQTRAYAAAIVETLEYLSRPRPALPLVASGLGEVRFFERRLKMIMSKKAPRKLSRFGLLAMVGAGALLLPLLPGIAQTQGERGEKEREARERQERREGEEREGRERERRERQERGERDERRHKIEQLHRRLRELHEEFEMQRRKFERAAEEIHEALRRLGAEPPRPPRPRGPEGRGEPLPGPERHIFELERRMRRLEEMVERLMVQIERRGFGPPPRDFRDRPRDREGGPPRPPFGRERDRRFPPEGGPRPPRPRPDQEPPRPPQPPRPDRPERPEA